VPFGGRWRGGAVGRVSAWEGLEEGEGEERRSRDVGGLVKRSGDLM